MASRLYLRNLTPGPTIGTALRLMLPGRGSTGTPASGVVLLTAGGNQINWTQTSGGTVLEFVTPRVPSGGFTLDGNVTFNIWANESNNNDEMTISARLYQRHTNGTETEVPGGPFSYVTELTNTIAVNNWTGNPTSTAFAEDERLVVRFFADATTTMTAGTGTLRYDTSTVGGTGDSYIELTETVDWKTETITKTIKTSGGDYALLSTWEAAQQSDLVTDDVIAQAECYAGAYTDLVNILGWTTGASNYVRIYTPTAERHNGTSRDVSGAGCQFSNAGTVIAISEDYVRIDGLDTKSTGATTSCISTAATITATNNDIRVENCIGNLTASTSATNSVFRFVDDFDANVTVINNIVYTSGTSIAICIDVGNVTTAFLAHNTCHAKAGVGIRWGTGAGDTHTLWNNWASSLTTTAYSVIGTSGTEVGGYNASDDATGDDGGLTTGALINVTTADQFVSITEGAEDFHLVTGSSLEAAGSPTAAVALDIDGEARDGTTPDIGADEAVFITGTAASNLNAVTAAFIGIEEFTGSVAANLNAVTAALAGESVAGAPDGTIASSLNAVTSALAGEETFTGTVAGSLNPVTSALTGAETFAGTLAGTLEPVQGALAGDVLAAVTGDLASTLGAVTAALDGIGGVAAAPAPGGGDPVYSRATYASLKKRRKKKREELEALARELRILLGLERAPQPSPGASAPAEAIAAAPLPLPSLAGVELLSLRSQVATMLEAVRELEERHALALDDDDDAILALMEAT